MKRFGGGIVADLAKTVAMARFEQNKDLRRPLVRKHLDLTLGQLGIKVTTGQPEAAQIRLDGFILGVVEGLALFEGQLVQQGAVKLVAARIPLQQNIEAGDDDRLPFIHLNHHFGRGFLVATQGDFRLVVAIYLQRLLHALGNFCAGRAVLPLLIDRQGIEVGFNVILVLPFQPLDLIGELGSKRGRSQQRQQQAHPQNPQAAAKGRARQ